MHNWTWSRQLLDTLRCRALSRRSIRAPPLRRARPDRWWCAGYIQRAQLPQVYAPAPAPALGPAAFTPQEELQAADALPAASTGAPVTKMLSKAGRVCSRPAP